MDSSFLRQIASDANRRQLRNLPAFRVEQKLPTDLGALLDRLDRAEERRGAQQQ